jgi:hypothetical protein
VLIAVALGLLATVLAPASATAAAPVCTLLKLTKPRDVANPAVSQTVTCTDADGDALSYALQGTAGTPSNGTFSLAGATVTYTPPTPSFAGLDYQTLEVSDGGPPVWVDVEVFISRSALDTTVSGPTTVTAGTTAAYAVTANSGAHSQDSELLDGFVQTTANSNDGVAYAGSTVSCAPGGSASLYVSCNDFATVPAGGSVQYTVSFSFGAAAVGKTFHFTFATSSPLATQTSQNLVVTVVAASGAGGNGGAGGGGGAAGGAGGAAGGGGAGPGAPGPAADTTPPTMGAITAASSITGKALLRFGYAGRVTGLTSGDSVVEQLEVAPRIAARIGLKAKARVVIGRGAANAQGVARVVVKLTAKAKAAVRRKQVKSVAATLVIKATDGAGNTTVRRKPVSIKLR